MISGVTDVSAGPSLDPWGKHHVTITTAPPLQPCTLSPWRGSLTGTCDSWIQSGGLDSLTSGGAAVGRAWEASAAHARAVMMR